MFSLGGEPPSWWSALSTTTALFPPALRRPRLCFACTPGFANPRQRRRGTGLVNCGCCCCARCRPGNRGCRGPRATAGSGWSACEQTGRRRHASRTSSSGGDEDIGTRIVKLATVESPPPYECLYSRLKVGRQRERATAHRLVHTAAHSFPVSKQLEEVFSSSGYLCTQSALDIT